MNHSDFFLELKHNLPVSTGDDRKKWAQYMDTENVDLNDLSKLFDEDKKVVSRFMWLLSEVGAVSPLKLLEYLPFVLSIQEKIQYQGIEATLANLWLISGVPEENEAAAIELLFNWIQSPKFNVTTKSRSIKVLKVLAKKYPELKNEIELSIQG